MDREKKEKMIALEVADDFTNYDEHVVAWLLHALKVLQEQSFAPRPTGLRQEADKHTGGYDTACRPWH
jgi:hypothetical protein